MIKLNSKKLEKINFKGLFEDEARLLDLSFINMTRLNDISFSDSTNAIYFYLGSKNSCTYTQIYDGVSEFLTKTNYNLNIDVDSFMFSEDVESSRAIIEATIFGEHNPYNLKTEVPKREVVFNLITQKIDEAIFKKIYVKSFNLIKSINISRDLSDQPPNICTPLNFINSTKSILEIFPNLKVTVLSREDCENLKMELFLSVGAGSINPSGVIIVEYNGNPSSVEKTAVIGKGITMDTGGYALKEHINQRNERFDMCGASCVISSMYGIANEKPKINIVAIGAMSENRIGGGTTLNSSIIESMSGKTVEIQSTDAEGRLVMADCITYAIEKLKATKIITIATLTGSAIAALGKTMSAIMTNNRNFLQEIERAAKLANEPIWELPLTNQNYQRARASQYADLINGSWEKYNTAGLAGAFLNNFTKELPFIHIDIAGSAYINERSCGTMVKTLIEYANK